MYNLEDNYFNSVLSATIAIQKHNEETKKLKKERKNDPDVLALKQLNRTIENQNKIIEKQRQDLEEERKRRIIEDKKNSRFTKVSTIISISISLMAVALSIILHFV